MFLWVPVASALPLDLSGFTADEGVIATGGTVIFTESMDSDQWWFYNDHFEVAENASTLSFDYQVNPGADDQGDYLEFDLAFEAKLFASETGPGQFSIDLSDFRGQTISLAWALVWGGDSGAGTVATLSNITLDTIGPNPVPELGTGLICLAFRSRKAHSGISSKSS